MQAPPDAAPALAAQSEPEPAHPLLLYNTMARQKQRFAPRPDQGSRVSLYCCGVTVYDYSHIGALGGLRRWSPVAPQLCMSKQLSPMPVHAT